LLSTRYLHQFFLICSSNHLPFPHPVFCSFFLWSILLPPVYTSREDDYIRPTTVINPYTIYLKWLFLICVELFCSNHVAGQNPAYEHCSFSRILAKCYHTRLKNRSQFPCMTFSISSCAYPRLDNIAGMFCRSAIVSRS
jgi:hypothetical protein